MPSSLRNFLSSPEIQLNGDHFANSRPTNIIVYFVGGVTYEEAYQIEVFNNEHKGTCKVLIGGADTLNPTQFMQEIALKSGSMRR